MTFRSSTLAIGSLVPVFALLACGSSSDFKVSEDPNDTGTAADGSDTGGGGDGPVDTAVDPCASEPGKSKFCVTVELDSKHPGYEAASGADKLQIDGSGRVFVFLFDSDPAKSDGIKPVVTLQYPPVEKVGAEVKVEELPVTIVGEGPPKDYWVIASYQDNKTAERGTGEKALFPGDFVLVPPLGADKKYAWPKVSLKDGTTQKQTLHLLPYRYVGVDVTTGLKFKADYPKDNYAINGDGPILFALYDGDLGSGKEVVVDFDVGNCVKMDPYSITPPIIRTSFGTTVDGTHRLLAAVIDYEFGDPFPTPGTLLTALDAASAPTVTISTSSWVSSAGVVRLVQVASPYTPKDGVVDKIHCP